ncbi:MAG TPA: NADPH-dependent FMN reductase [Ferrovibrio sp.]|uniref:NADPH-dependent FMN reductase n=1 Tax=Ferrovibrio sp. TaxID=1917215 RepID=UPI002ED6A74A
MPSEAPLTLVTMLGSLRRGSYNAAIARSLPELAPPSVTIAALGSVGDFPLYNADLQAEGFPAAVRRVGEEIGAADGLIFVTPEYNYSVPGVLKNAIDWLSRLPEKPFKHKPVLIQSASPGLLGGARAQYHLRQMLVYLDTYAMNVPEVMVNQVASKVDETSGRLTDQASRDFIAGQLKAFVAFIRDMQAFARDRPSRA